MPRVAVVMLAAVLAWVGSPPGAVAAAVRGVQPIARAPVVRGFDPPAARWGAGHRGVDLASTPGAVVVTPAAGVVSYAQVLAGRPVLVITHGELRTTLEPVESTVPVGTRVARGDPVGVLIAGHSPCPAAACLHWGLKRGDTYLNPLSLQRGEVRLLSDAAAAAIRGSG